MSRLIECLLEQHALIVLLIERGALPTEVDRVFSSSHTRRAIYAHIAVVRDVLGPHLDVGSESRALEQAAAKVVDCVAELASSGSNSPIAYHLLLAPLTVMFAAQLSAIATAFLGFFSEEANRLAILVEDRFESLYGHGEMSAERGPSQFAAL